MIIKCPSCGAQHSLDAIVADRAAADALTSALRMAGGVGEAMLRYLALHRPAKSALSFPRVARLLGELLPDVQAQRIERNGQVFDAPPAAWAWAVDQMIARRDAGQLSTPLKSHGYLYEIIAGGGWRPAVPVDSPVATAMSNIPQKPSSSTARQLSGLAALRPGGSAQ